MKRRARYTAIGFVVSKLVIPFAKRQAKSAAKKRASDAATGAANVARSRPARTSIAVGAAVGAIGWLLARGRSTEDRSDRRS